MLINSNLPGILFPAISLLFLAYTNRYLALTSVTRSLLKERTEEYNSALELQLSSLLRRMKLIRHMQIQGLTSILFSALSIGLITVGLTTLGTISFFLALLFFIISMILCIVEINLSIQAITIALNTRNL